MYRFILFVALLITGCSTNQQEQTKEDNNEQGIKDLALNEGNRVAGLAQKALGSQLKKAIGEGGVPYAIQFCNTAAYPILDSVSTKLNTEIKRAAIKARNQDDLPTPTEKEILEKYAQELQNGQELTPTLTSLNEEELLFAKPIMINNTICLNCHGMQGKEVTEETAQLITELYPQDKAMGHKFGDLRGIWSIKFAKADLKKLLQTTE